ncbi:MAG TPA: STAS domain-containing protein [Bacteroidota bacterium]|nr:STAS domain-containing protein [Bacteroidota bacterium]
MQIKEKMENDVAVLTLKGDLLGEPDTTSLRDKIHSLVNDEVKHVVVDLGGVSYMNSSGLGTLISALTTMRGSGGDLRLARVEGKVQNLFVMTQLVKVFDTYETLERALASFKSKPK